MWGNFGRVKHYICEWANLYQLQSKIIPYSGKISRTINFAVFEDFTTTSKINSSKSYSIESYDSLVDPQNLIREMYRGEITSKIFSLENYPLYSS